MRRLLAALILLVALGLTTIGCHHDESGGDDRKTGTSQPSFGYIPIVATVNSTGSSQVGGGNKISMTINLWGTSAPTSESNLAVTLVAGSTSVPNGNVDTKLTDTTATAVLSKAFGTGHPIDTIPVAAGTQSIDFTYPKAGNLQPGSYTLVICAIEKPTAGGVAADWYSCEKAIPVELK